MRVRGKISIAFLISFLSFILCFILGFIVIDLYYIFYTIQGGTQDYVIFIFLVALPFCGAYVGFCLCYSGKLYVKRGFSSLIVPALFGMIPITILLIILLEISTITDIDSDFDADAIRAGCLDISYITPPFFQKETVP